VSPGVRPGARTEDGQLFFDDLAVGDRWASPSRTLTDAGFAFFAAATGDNHPLHYDDEYAKGTRFGRRVAHGLLVMATTAVGASPLTHRLHASMIAFVKQGCRFLRPVLVGDTVYPEHEVQALEPKGDRGVVRLAARVKNQRGETVLDGFHVYLVRRRPAPAGRVPAGAGRPGPERRRR
jgi:3-hydroxybutyryl-CoA dehydratase